MEFINPKMDFAFKKIFGDEQHKNILISFLNAILYAGRPTIQNLQILNPHNAPKVSGLKDSFLDVKARLDNNDQVIIEMQVLAVKGFDKRVLYNIVKAYVAQLKTRESYTTLNPVIGLTITDFKMFSDDEVSESLSRFVMYDELNKIEYPTKDIELVFVELPKFKKELAVLRTIMDKWLYFMRHADELEDVPQAMKEEPDIEQAFRVANQINLSQEDLDILEKQELFTYDMNHMVENAVQTAVRVAVRDAVRDAEQKATKKGIRKGRKKGIEKGIEKGRREEKLNLARQLFDILDDEIISEKIGLTVDELGKLRQLQQQS